MVRLLPHWAQRKRRSFSGTSPLPASMTNQQSHDPSRLMPTSTNWWPALAGQTPSYPAAYPSVRGLCATGGPVAVKCLWTFSSGFACMPRRSIGCRLCRRTGPGA